MYVIKRAAARPTTSSTLGGPPCARDCKPLVHGHASATSLRLRRILPQQIHLVSNGLQLLPERIGLMGQIGESQSIRAFGEARGALHQFFDPRLQFLKPRKCTASIRCGRAQLLKPLFLKDTATTE